MKQIDKEQRTNDKCDKNDNDFLWNLNLKKKHISIYLSLKDIIYLNLNKP